jgi:hypothetical protein
MADDRTTFEKALPWACWTLSVASFVAYLSRTGFAPSPPSDFWEGTFLWIALGFFVFPAVSSLKVGTILELKRDAVRAKDETAALRQQISVLSTTMTAVASSVNMNVVHVNVSQGEARADELRAEPPRRGTRPRGAAPPIGLRALTKPASLDANDFDDILVGRAPSTAPAARTPMELKILNTLWRWQVRKFEDVSTRFTFKIEFSNFTQDGATYQPAVDRLTADGLIAQTEGGYLGLTDAGLRYCRDNYLMFGRDAYFDEDKQPPIAPEKLAQVIATIPPEPLT